jgi:2-haloacid dehalogenase
MAKPIGSVKALVFDVGGTVFDWHGTIQARVEALARERSAHCDASAVAVDWRRRMFVLLEQMRAGEITPTNADGLHRLALDDILPTYPELDLSVGERDQLNEVWHQLRVWPDFPEALDTLKTKYTVIVLTILSWSIVVDSSKLRGLWWDGVLSCEFLGGYKPDHEAYLSATRLLRIRPEEAMMVAAHPGDLQAASEVGYRTAFVARQEAGQHANQADLRPFPNPGPYGPFDVWVEDFAHLASELT